MRSVNDVTYVKADCPDRVNRIGLPRTRSTHLARIAVTFEHLCPQCRRDGPRELILSRLRRLGHEQVFPRSEAAVVMVGRDGPSLLGANLAYPSRPLRHRGHLAQLLLGDDFANVLPQETLQPFLRAAHAAALRERAEAASEGRCPTQPFEPVAVVLLNLVTQNASIAFPASLRSICQAVTDIDGDWDAFYTASAYRQEVAYGALATHYLVGEVAEAGRWRSEQGDLFGARTGLRAGLRAVEDVPESGHVGNWSGARVIESFVSRAFAKAPPDSHLAVPASPWLPWCLNGYRLSPGQRRLAL